MTFLKKLFKKQEYSLLIEDSERIYNTENCSICFLKGEKDTWAGWYSDSKRLLCFNCFNQFYSQHLKESFKIKTKIFNNNHCCFCGENSNCYVINCCKYCKKYFSY